MRLHFISLHLIVLLLLLLGTRARMRDMQFGMTKRRIKARAKLQPTIGAERRHLLSGRPNSIISQRCRRRDKQTSANCYLSAATRSPGQGARRASAAAEQQ